MADSGHPPAELHERLLICRTIKLNAGAHGGHRRCCHAQMQKNAQNKPQIARLILCVHTTLQVYCNLFLTFCSLGDNGINGAVLQGLYGGAPGVIVYGYIDAHGIQQLAQNGIDAGALGAQTDGLAF